MTAKERVSRVAVVHGCFAEGGNPFKTFSWEPLRIDLQDNLRVSLASYLTKSHDQPGCARARIHMQPPTPQQ